MAADKKHKIILQEALRRPVEEIDRSYVDNYYINDTKAKIIDMIYRMRFMNTKDIQRALGYKSYSDLTKILRVLYEDRFLNRRMRPYELRMAGEKEVYHMLDIAGALFIQNYYGLRELDEVKWHERDNRIKFDFANHSLAISKVYSRLEEAAKNNNDLLRDAYCDRHLFTKFYYGKEFQFAPDMFFKYKKGNKVYGFFVEVDLGTMAATGSINTNSFDQKVAIYENFKKANKSFFGFSAEFFPRVLVLTTTRARAENLALAVKKKQDEIKKNDVVFLFSVLSLFEKSPLEKIFIDTSYSNTENIRNMFE